MAQGTVIVGFGREKLNQNRFEIKLSILLHILEYL
jgi:hypothetical protein